MTCCFPPTFGSRYLSFCVTVIWGLRLIDAAAAGTPQIISSVPLLDELHSRRDFRVTPETLELPIHRPRMANNSADTKLGAASVKLRT